MICVRSSRAPRATSCSRKSSTTSSRSRQTTRTTCSTWLLPCPTRVGLAARYKNTRYSLTLMPPSHSSTLSISVSGQALTRSAGDADPGYGRSCVQDSVGYAEHVCRWSRAKASLISSTRNNYVDGHVPKPHRSRVRGTNHSAEWSLSQWQLQGAMSLTDGELRRNGGSLLHRPMHWLVCMLFGKTTPLRHKYFLTAEKVV